MRSDDTCPDEEPAAHSGVRPCASRAPLSTHETLPPSQRVFVDVWDDACARAPTQPAILPDRIARRHAASWPRVLRAFMVGIAIANVVLVAWNVATEFARLFAAG